MTSTAMVHVRVDEETKERAAQALAEVGLSVSDAVRLFLRRVVIEQGMPISLKLPNAETRTALAEADNIANLRFKNVKELISDIEKNAKTKKSKNPTKE